MSERSHVHRVFLPAEHYVGISKIQADLEIGKSAAILDMINEGLFHRGCISQTVYDSFKKKYERKLVEIVRHKNVKFLTKEELEEQKVLRVLEKRFSQVIEQWPTMKEKSKQYWKNKAEEYEPTVPNAKFVLALANGESVSPNLVEKREGSK